MFRTDAPPDESAFRRALYTGEIFRLPANATSTKLVADVNALLERELGGNPREAQFHLSDAEFFKRTDDLMGKK